MLNAQNPSMINSIIHFLEPSHVHLRFIQAQPTAEVKGLTNMHDLWAYSC